MIHQKIIAIIYTLAVIGLVAHEFRYELNLVAPKFKVGDCVEHKSNNRVKLFMGDVNKKYKTFIYFKVGQRNLLDIEESAEEEFSYIDNNFKKVDCPQFELYFRSNYD